MSDQGDIIADSAERIFREFQKPTQGVGLWQALDEAGLTRTWVPESLDGAGATLADGFTVLRISGTYSTSTPLAETLLAGWLLTEANLSLPRGALTVAPVDLRDRIMVSSANRLSGTARAIPFARDATNLVLIAPRGKHTYVAVVDAEHCHVSAGENLAKDPRDTVKLSDVEPLAIASTALDFERVLLMGAAVRSMQMAGALQKILDLSVAYANERVAFEKPIGKFQAIQHSLARLAGEAAAAIAAAGSAADAIASAHSIGAAEFLEIASAKIRVGEAATAGCAIAHQVHGAIGFSEEHVLHRYTQRLWAWRDDFGSESFWAARLGERIAAAGADALWPLLASR